MDSIFAKRRIANRWNDYLGYDLWSAYDAAKLTACGNTDCIGFPSCVANLSFRKPCKDKEKVLVIYEMLNAEVRYGDVIPQDYIQWALSKGIILPQEMLDWYNERQANTDTHTIKVADTSKIQIAQGGSNPETDKINATNEHCESVEKSIKSYLDGKGKIGFSEFEENVKQSMRNSLGSDEQYQERAARAFFKSSSIIAPFKRRRGEKK